MSGRRALAPPLAALALLAAAPAVAAEQCGVCHPQERVAFADSIHAREEVGCADCHGGDATAREVAAAHRGNFRSLAERTRTPALCAECHADLARMRAYNLPVDQYAVYQTSQHGQAVARGDDRAAVCTDCHGVHDIQPSDDPRSPIHHRRLPDTCARCHGDPELMAGYGLDPGVVEAYRTSVHGRAILDRGNAAAPDCTSCHGVHGATPPGVGDLDKVCGACHVQTRRAFIEGPHYRGMLDAGLPECESCHSNHAIQRFELASLDGQCAECHGAGSEPALLGDKIYALIDAAAAEVDEAEELALEAERAGLDVEDHLSRVEEARTYLTEVLALVHTVRLEPVEQVTRRARSIGEEVQHELYSKLDRRPAHLGLAVFWFYLLMTVAILIGFKRRLRRRGEAA